MQEEYVQYRDRYWQIQIGPRVIVSGDACDGVCIDDRPPVIYIDGSLSGVEMLETILHEGLHAEFPDLSEESVTRAAKNSAVACWKLREFWSKHDASDGTG